MRKMICPALTAAAACSLFAACAQPSAPIQPLPSGPTLGEVADYARAQAQYRSALASGDGDAAVTGGWMARPLVPLVLDRKWLGFVDRALQDFFRFRNLPFPRRHVRNGFRR